MYKKKKSTFMEYRANVQYKKKHAFQRTPDMAKNK